MLPQMFSHYTDFSNRLALIACNFANLCANTGKYIKQTVAIKTIRIVIAVYQGSTTEQFKISGFYLEIANCYM